MSKAFIPYSCQLIEEDDIEAVVRVLRSEWLTQGPDIEAFEKNVATYCKSPHAVAVSSATAGLHLACMALGIGEGDLVWTSPLSFAASANCARYVGAEVDFVDIDSDTGNMCVSALKTKLEMAEKTGRLPTCVIPVHYAGRACDMPAIHALKEQYKFSLIEDAAHALGGRYGDGTPVGCNPASDMAVFSFHPVKPITTGEGGMVTTHNPELAERLRQLRTHGITRDTAKLQKKNRPAWYYEQQSLGYNYRITDMQAALGSSQMAKLDRFIDRRRALAERYLTLLKSLPLMLPLPDRHSGWHLYAVRIDPSRTQTTRDEVFATLRAQNIGVNVHYMPIHWQPYYQSLGFKEGQFPKAEAFFNQELSLPMHPRLSDKDQDFVAQTLANALT